VVALPERVTTIDDVVSSSHESRGVGSQEDGKTVQVIDGTKTLLRSLVNPDTLLSLKSWNAVECSVHVTWGDGVDTNLVASPFSGKRLGHLNNGGLGGVVARLLPVNC